MEVQISFKKFTPFLIKLLGLLVCIWYGSASNVGFSQVVLEFNNNTGDGAYIGGGTGAGSVGAVYQWPNVGTEGSTTIKATIEILAKYGNATLTKIDGTSSLPDWEPQISGPSTTNGNFWGIKFLISFLDASTGLPYNLSSFVVQSIDIDGGGTGSALREYTTFQSPASYQTEEPTELTVSTVAEGKEFLSSEKLYNGISITATEYIASCTYVNINSITIICGVKAVGGTCSGNRLHSINFRNVVVFNEPEYIPLPVDLLHFDVQMTPAGTLVDWSTASENNNYYFTIERSTNGIDFTGLEMIYGAGNSLNLINYSFLDKNPLQGKSYYRLKQTDYDGSFTYSDALSVNMDYLTRDLLKKMNMMGQAIENDYKGFVIETYSDGTTAKAFQ